MDLCPFTTPATMMAASAGKRRDTADTTWRPTCMKLCDQPAEFICALCGRLYLRLDSNPAEPWQAIMIEWRQTK
jgi:hypothetical protein